MVVEGDGLNWKLESLLLNLGLLSSYKHSACRVREEVLQRIVNLIL